MTTDNCGVAEHEPDCLCDVVIRQETPWIGDAVQDMWMGQEIVNLAGFTQEWDDESIIDYLCKLLYAKDHWDRTLIGSDIVRVKAGPAVLRREIKRRLQTDDSPSILRIVHELDISHDELMLILFTSRRSMSYEELAEFERDVLERKFSSAHSLGKKYGMLFRSADQLHSYWGVPYATKSPKSDPINTRMDELFADETLSNKDISAILQDEFNVKIHLDKIRNRRGYLKRRTKNVNA